MAALYLFDVVSRIRTRADQVSSSRNSDSEILVLVGQSIGYLTTLVAQGSGDHLLEDVTITASGTENLTMEPNVNQIRGVDWSPDGNRWYTMSIFNFVNRNIQTAEYSMFPGEMSSRYQFRPWGRHIKIIPTPPTGDKFKIWYLPVFSLALSDQFNFWNNWDEFCIVDCAIKLKEKDEEDCSVLMAERQRLEEKIRSDTRGRSTEAGTAVDLETSPFFARFW